MTGVPRPLSKPPKRQSYAATSTATRRLANWIQKKPRNHHLLSSSLLFLPLLFFTLFVSCRRLLHFFNNPFILSRILVSRLRNSRTPFHHVGRQETRRLHHSHW